MRSLRSSLVLLLFSANINAATFVVNTPDDLVDLDLSDNDCITAANNCSLRAAIQQSNHNQGEDTITLLANTYNLTLVGVNEDAAATGDLDITDDLIINGAGANLVFIDGYAADRIFHLSPKTGDGTPPAYRLTLNGVTLRNGLADGLGFNNTNSNTGGFGGAIHSQGYLTINDSNLDSNKAFNGGASIYAMFRGFPAAGSLTINRSNLTRGESNGGGGGFGGHIYAENIPMYIRDSVIKGNVANGTSGAVAGGGIYYNDGSQPFPYSSSIINTTISNNRVMSYGGGIHVAMGNLTIENSTISSNTSYQEGGGLSVDWTGTVNITNSTIAYNSALSAGGILDNSSHQGVTITDSIVSTNIGLNCKSTLGIISLGNNLDDENTCGFNLNNQPPLLLPLADNGGPGFTHALDTNISNPSPALNAAANCLTIDQRSYTRPSSNCDLGAVEMEGVAPITPIVTPPENSQITVVNNQNNNAPVAYDLPAAVIAGGVLHGIMNAFDPDGDPLTYEITQQPGKGNVGFPVPGSTNDIPGGYSYSPLATASGSDSFKYKACDPSLACSAERTIYITITSGTVSGDLNVQLTPTAGNVNDLVIVSDNELSAIAPDTNYSYPNGAYFFSVNNIPAQSQQTVVTIQLPNTANVPSNAVVRKLDNTGTWQTMSNTASASTSSAVIDAIAKTITLTLVDNDAFDLNPETGVINDPVALGVAQAANVTCDAGSYGTTSCTLADPGYFVATSGQETQTQCPAGTYSNTTGAVSCINADAGYFINTTAATQQEACPAGYYNNTVGATECIPAAIGYYVASAAQTNQTACSAGSYTNTLAQTTCTQAEVGHFAVGPAATTQTECSAGTYSNAPGLSACLTAQPGYFVARAGAISQTLCPVGRYSDTTSSTACTSAPLGKYVDSIGASSALNCPAGTTTSAEGATSAGECIASSNGGGAMNPWLILMLLMSQYLISRQRDRKI